MRISVRSLTSVTLGMFAALSHAQLVNGSFEDLNSFSLDGWSYGNGAGLNGPAIAARNDAPPGFGSWSAAPYASQSTEGIFWMAQQVGPLMVGDIYTISFWVKCPQQYEHCACLHINDLVNGTICANTPDWSFVTLTDTAGVAGNLEILFRTKSTGLAGNINPRPAYIDGVTFEVNGHVGLSDIVAAHQLFRFDSDNRTLLLRPERDLQCLRICDATGRSVLHLGPIPAGQEAIFSLQDLPSGLYVAMSDRFDQRQLLKFVLQ